MSPIAYSGPGCLPSNGSYLSSTEHSKRRLLQSFFQPTKVTTQQELRYPSKVEILLKRHLIDNAEKPILFINSCGDSSEFLSPKYPESATS
jgi:hypothetical protein